MIWKSSQTPMYSLNLPQDLEQHIAFLAKETGRDKEDLMNEALSRGLQDLIEDLEDIIDAKKVLQSSSRQWTLEEVEAGLDREKQRAQAPKLYLWG